MTDETHPAEMPSSSVGQHRRSPLWVVARNTIFGIGAQITLRGLAFVFNIFIVNRLGDAGFGQYSTILAWTGIFAFLGDMGIAQYMSREIARDREKSLALFWDVAALRFLLAVLATVVTVTGAILAGYSRELVFAIALLSSTYFIQAVLTPLGGIITGYERIDIASALVVLGQIIYYGLATVLLLYSPNYLWLVVAAIANLPVLTIVAAWVVARNKMRPPPFKLHPESWLALLRFGLPFALIQVSLTFAFRFDTLILGKSFSDEVVGWYNAAYTLTRSLMIFTAAFSTSLVPTLAREYVLDPQSIRPWYFRSVKFISLIGLPLAVGGTILADKIILTLYGTEFVYAILAFAILIWDTPLLMYTSICGNFTTAMKIEAKAARVYIGMSLLNIVLNVALIPRYGILAASVVTVATEFAGMVLFYRIFRRALGPGLGLSSMIRMGAALAVMGLAVFLARDAHILLLLALGAGVYVALIWLLRVLTPEEYGLLIGSLKRIRAKIGKRR